MSMFCLSSVFIIVYIFEILLTGINHSHLYVTKNIYTRVKLNLFSSSIRTTKNTLDTKTPIS